MKIASLLLSLLLLVSCSSREGFLDNSESSEESAPFEEAESQEETPVKEEESTPSIEISKEEEKSEEENKEPSFRKDDWRLILVNRDNLIPDDFKVNLAKVHGYLVDERIKEPYENMYEAAKKDGVDLLLCYGYRTKEQSEGLFKKQIDRQTAGGLSYEAAVEEAKKWVAPPGTSEHHTGLALDIVTPSYQVLNHDFKNTGAAKWMKENAHKYGFILRYPENKEDITGITFEPWHYRYVGEEAAKYIYENDLCLEEFLKGDNII